MDADSKFAWRIGLWVVTICLVVVVGGCWGYPHYQVFQQTLAGEAELKHAEYSKRIAVETAKAKNDSATFEAAAEVARAKGVAQANQIIGESLKQNEDYLKYLWVNQLEKSSQMTVIYVPTESNLPILEASRLSELRSK